MSIPNPDLAKILEEAVATVLGQHRFVEVLNSLADGGVVFDVKGVSPLSDLLDIAERGVDIGLVEELSGRIEHFRLRIEPGEIILPHPSAARPWPAVA